MAHQFPENHAACQPDAARAQPSAWFPRRCAGCEIVVMDGDASVIRELKRLLVPLGFTVRAHTKIEELLKTGCPGKRSCLVLGAARNDDHSGLEILTDLRRRNWNIPIVVTAKNWNIRLIVAVMRAGADGFLPRPFDPRQMLDSLCQAMEHDGHASPDSLPACEARSRLASLNFREREVVRMVVGGLFNKEIADQMALAVVTVKVYRARAMKKLGAGNAAELAKIAMLAGLRETVKGAVKSLNPVIVDGNR